jgi:hypothetical protein
MIPASPWTGSTMKAAVHGVIAASSAPASPNGTWRKPGVKGPNPSRYWASLEKPTIVVVRPAKLPAATMISARPAGTRFTR